MMRIEDPDLLLLDVMMPKMDGGDVLNRMKKEIRLRNIPVIIVTARADSIDKVLWMSIAQVDDYVTKPFGPRDLVESVETVLAKHAEFGPETAHDDVLGGFRRFC